MTQESFEEGMIDSMLGMAYRELHEYSMETLDVRKISERLERVCKDRYVKVSVIAQNNAGIHAAFFCEYPLAVYLKIFGIYRGAVVVSGGNAVSFNRFKLGIGRVYEFLQAPVGSGVFGHFKSHVYPSKKFS